MKTKIPKFINILGHKWAVKFVNNLELNRIGEAEWPARVIRINKESHKSMHWPVFLHEVRHAFQFESGFSQLLDPQATEVDADTFSSFIISLQSQGVL